MLLILGQRICLQNHRNQIPIDVSGAVELKLAVYHRAVGRKRRKRAHMDQRFQLAYSGTRLHTHIAEGTPLMITVRIREGNVIVARVGAAGADRADLEATVPHHFDCRVHRYGKDAVIRIDPCGIRFHCQNQLPGAFLHRVLHGFAVRTCGITHNPSGDTHNANTLAVQQVDSTVVCHNRLQSIHLQQKRIGIFLLLLVNNDVLFERSLCQNILQIHSFPKVLIS